MYLMYADESGDLSTPDVSHFVVAGIALHEDAVRPFAGEINGTINRYIGRALGIKVELHGNEIRAGRAAGWREVSVAKRRAMTLKLLDKACNWKHEPSRSKPQPFVVVIDRNHSTAPTETVYGELLHLFDEFLRRGRRGGNAHNGVLIAVAVDISARYKLGLRSHGRCGRGRLRTRVASTRSPRRRSSSTHARRD